VQVVVMGVAGSGKTTVGRTLANAIGFEFHDGDAHHPAANLAKMAAGRPLTDGDREPWLAALHDLLAEARAEQRGVVLACSALAQRHRQRLGLVPGEDALVYLRASESLLRERLRGRVGHFMREPMLASQLAVLEEPAHAIVCDASLPLDVQVAAVRRALGR
jgi:gluconokinase